jgi:hypothetical protein
MRVTRLLSFWAVFAMAAACSKSSTPPATPTHPPLLGTGDCDPIVPEECGFPLPSNVWTYADPTTPTGLRVVFGPTTFPERVGGGRARWSTWSKNDGFSPGQPLMTYLANATVTGLPTQDTIDQSLQADAPTVLMEADSGARVPHFAELDESDPGDPRKTLMIRPVVRLKDATRYVVAIRHIVDAGGQPIAPSPAFVALRDKGTSSEPSVQSRRNLYEDIFSKLDKAGIQRSDLQIAWDFTTTSRDNNTKWLVHMRDDALAKVGDMGPTYTITKVEENPNPHIRRRITGLMTVPLYLDSPMPGPVHMVLGPDGLPKQNGTMDVEFLVHIPNSLANAGKAGPLVQNGHGLLGSKTEGQDGYLAEFADEKGYVAFAVDLQGMAHEDNNFVLDTVGGDLGNFELLFERQHQGILNSLLAMRMMKGRFVNEPMATFNGASVIDPTHVYYRGDSQGGIFGTTYMSLSTDVTRGLLGEPGYPYSLLLNRSMDFGIFLIVIRGSYPNPLDVQLDLGLIQMLWDRTEPDGYAPYIVENMLPGTPQHEILIHVAIGDHQVTPLGAHVLARTVHAKNVKPTNRELWGIDDADAPIQSGSAMVEFDFGLPEAPKTNIPMMAGDDPHDKVRGLPAAFDQSDKFFREGVIDQFCMGGPCKGM